MRFQVSTYCLVPFPIPQPINGVIPSISPKIRAIRNASDYLDIYSAAPLPIATAKASVDMASAIRAVEMIFMSELSKLTRV